MRTPILVLLAALPLSFACQSSGPPDLTKEQKLGIYYENALRYFELRDLERTEHQCVRALQLDPSNERFLLILGNVHLRRGRTEDIANALVIFEEHPTQSDYRVHLGKGEAHERLAVLELEAAEQIASGERYTEATSPEERADQLRASSNEHIELAIADFHRAEDIHDGELNAINGLIRTYALLGKDELSIDWSERLIDVLETSSRVRRVEMDDVEILASREAELMRAIRRNSEMVIKARFHVASLQRRLGRLQEATDELGRIISLDPELSAAYSRRAQLFLELGQYLKAKESVERYIQLEATRPFDHPEIREAYELLGRCQAALAGDLAAGN